MTLRTITLALVNSTAEYCAPVCCRNAHTRLIDTAINNILQIVTGCLRPAPGDNLALSASIQPAELHRNGVTLSLARRARSLDTSIHTQRSPVHRVQMHVVLNRDIHLYPPHNISSVHLTTITYVRRCE